MPNFYDAAPSSLRQPSDSSRLAKNDPAQPFRPMLLPASPLGRATAFAKSRFARLPQEPEDAKITGVTRSLNRRLLALNVGGSLLRGDTAASPKVPVLRFSR